MTTRFLLHTNVVSEPLRPQPPAVVMRRLRDHDSEMAFPALVRHELRSGCARLARSLRREAIERHLDRVQLCAKSDTGPGTLEDQLAVLSRFSRRPKDCAEGS